MKMQTMISVCVTFVAMDIFGESRSTVPNMIGAKMRPRFSVRFQDGGCIWRPLRAGFESSVGAGFRPGTSSGSSSLPSASSHTYS